MSGGGGGTSPTTSATAGGGSTTSTGGLGGLLAPLAQQLTAQGPSFGGGPFVGPAIPTPWGSTQESKADYYNQQLGKGLTDTQIRANVEANQYGGPQSNSDWSQLVQTAGMRSPTGRPLAGSGQFYQPQYQPQYQNYSMTNPFSVSQYGQNRTTPEQSNMLSQLIDFAPAQPSSQTPSSQMSSGQLYPPQYPPRYEYYNTGNPMGGSQYGQMPDMFSMQTPFSMFGGQMQGGGYGQYGENNPYSPYSNTFLNMPSNLNRMGQADKVGFYQGAMDRGFNDQQMYNQASGLFGYQSPQDWSYLQNQAMQMQSPFRSSGPAQPIVSRSAGVRGTPNVIRRAEGGIASLIGDE